MRPGGHVCVGCRACAFLLSALCTSFLPTCVQTVSCTGVSASYCCFNKGMARRRWRVADPVKPDRALGLCAESQNTTEKHGKPSNSGIFPFNDSFSNAGGSRLLNVVTSIEPLFELGVLTASAPRCAFPFVTGRTLPHMVVRAEQKSSCCQLALHCQW